MKTFVTPGSNPDPKSAIIPFSSKFKGELALDRLGNYSPIMAKMNCSRGNRHIKNYWDDNPTKNIISFLDIFPDIKLYDEIVEYKSFGSNSCPYIHNNEKYNLFCQTNENKYITSFIENL